MIQLSNDLYAADFISEDFFVLQQKVEDEKTRLLKNHGVEVMDHLIFIDKAVDGYTRFLLYRLRILFKALNGRVLSKDEIFQEYLDN